VRHSLRDEPAVMGVCDVTWVGTMTVVEAAATLAGMTARPRSIAPVPNATLAILRDFIVTLRKEPALDPVGESFHTWTTAWSSRLTRWFAKLDRTGMVA
jgi:hypothetical protein